MIQIRQYLSSFSPVSELSWQALEKLFTLHQLKKGDYFIKEGQIATQFALLCSGIVRAFYHHENGKEYNKHFFIPTSIIGGYSSLITGEPNQFIQEALTDCELLVADYTALTKLYDSCPDLERCGRKFAENYFVQKERKEMEIIFLNAEERYQIFQKKYLGLEQLISQYHIASYLGISPTQLSRVRKKLARP